MYSKQYILYFLKFRKFLFKAIQSRYIQVRTWLTRMWYVIECPNRHSRLYSVAACDSWVMMIFCMWYVTECRHWKSNSRWRLWSVGNDGILTNVYVYARITLSVFKRKLQHQWITHCPPSSFPIYIWEITRARSAYEEKRYDITAHTSIKAV